MIQSQTAVDSDECHNLLVISKRNNKNRKWDSPTVRKLSWE